jgi:putative CocE/NonD family hydrolase
MSFMRLVLLLLSFVALASSQPMTPAASADYVKANYTKYEYRIPMRDGKRLFTSVYVPKDSLKTYPFLLSRTPYSVAPYGVDKYRPSLGPNELFLKSGYIFVYQDVRGRYLSEGVFVEMTPHRAVKKGPQDIDESTDTFDTIDWLLKNIKGNNGKAGIVGISYPGFYAAAGMIEAHPALKAASPQAPIIDLFKGDDSYHNGAFYLTANFGFYAFFGKKKTEPELPDPNARRFDFGTRDGYDFYKRLGSLSNADEKFFKRESPYWTDLLAHTTYDDFWKARNLAQHVKNISPAVLTVGGWYDAEDLQGPLSLDASLEQQSTATRRTLVMGPWVHGGWARGDGDKLGSVTFNQKSSVWFREKVEFPFFEHHLKEKADPKLSRAIVFETGTNRWRNFDQWPPKGSAGKLYFHAGGKLSLDPPVQNESFDEYVADPAKPVPFVGYTTLGMAQEYMVSDQRFASSRPDVLTYTSDVLEEDLVIAGPLKPNLFLESSGTDADYIVKLIDVYPDDYPDHGGYQQLLRGEPFRAKFRESFETARALVPGKQFEVNFSMPDIAHVFRRGHRVMVQIQSSWFPLVDLNPQRFLDIPNAKASDFVKASHRLFHDVKRPSGIAIQKIQ